MRQHLASPSKVNFRQVRVVFDETFNKSACLDLESHLIRWLAGDGQFEVANGNEGIVDARYYEREIYRESFADIFDRLRMEGLFRQTIPEIENSDLFKLSPFKVLTPEQASAVENILEGLFQDLAVGGTSTSVIEGHPGTGKTIVAIYLMKLLADIRDYDSAVDFEPDSVFAEHFVHENRELLRDLRIGIVVPQQSLRESIKRVFRKTPKLSQAQVLTPFDVGAAAEEWDILLVDETHRLNQRANQSSGVNNKRFSSINQDLFGADDLSNTQLDWIRAKSRHQIFLLDAEQTVRPADLPLATLRGILERAKADNRAFHLMTQMRVAAGSDYVAGIRALLRGEPSPDALRGLGDYDLRFFDDLGEMRRQILARNEEHGLARLLAGYAWKWRSRKDGSAFDIEIDDVLLRWNSTDKDWINQPTSVNEVGSIHTVQGYDLNHAGVIIGPDLRFDTVSGRLVVDRASYHDTKGKENNKQLGVVYSDDDLLTFIRNIYGVLLTRGILGTYIYVCDPALREYLRAQMPVSE
ncbi:DNA/RNA helicase domain-containing protein [Microbacterium sp. NPDC077663]|uniref:DNA/RNA helicase domain-containing protein n=1 Tax=Microbacterium sp. NPDC077663 TaxID=3364189 RepID=UPI0037CADC09